MNAVAFSVLAGAFSVLCVGLALWLGRKKAAAAKRAREMPGPMSALNREPTSHQRKKWQEYEYRNPYLDTEHIDHTTFWTAAPGVWYCRDCNEWFRTWSEEPEEHPQQGENPQ